MYGKLHRENGPARIERDRKSDVVVREAYVRNGEPYRDPAEGPAVIWRDRKSGAVIGEAYEPEPGTVVAAPVLTH
jgi:hypothetical protein